MQAEDEDEEEEEDEEENPFAARYSQTMIPSRQPWQTGTLVPDRTTLRPASFDDRPITPMKNTMVYSREYSTLDFKDGKLTADSC